MSGYPYSPPQQPKRSRTGLIIGLVAGLVVLCCCGAIAAFLLLGPFSWSGSSSPAGP